MNLVNQLKQRAEEHPARIALIEADGEISYAELYAEVCAGADFLRACGLKNGDCLLILEPISIPLYIHLLAVFHAGMTAMIVDPSTGKKALTHCLNICEPDGYIASPKAHLLRLSHSSIRKIPKHFHTHGYVPFSKKWRTSRSQTLPAKVAATHPALITFTSGSTGMPKAACRTHGFLLAQHEALAEALEFRSAEVDLITLPIFAIANLASGMTSVIANTDLRFPAEVDSAAIAAQCSSHQISRCAASPAFFQKLHTDENLPAFRTIYTGGAPVFPHLIDTIQKAHPELNIVTVYGSTEAEPISHIRWDQVSVADHQAMQTGNGLLVGKPVSATEVMICDSDSDDQIGEIAVTGEHVLKGYLHGQGDEETKFTKQGKIWHRTGDLGYLDQQQRLWLMGRVSAVFKINQQPIYPFGIECAVMHHPQITRCAVISYLDKPLLCVELSSGKIEDLAEILTPYPFLHPIQLDRIPMDKRHNAKVDYPELRKRLSSHPTLQK